MYWKKKTSIYDFLRPQVGTASWGQVPLLHRGGAITQGRLSGQGGASAHVFPGRWM